MTDERFDAGTQDVAEEPRLAAHPADEKRILIGPYGLRAGWSLLVFVLLLAAVMGIAIGIHNHWYPPPGARHAPPPEAGDHFPTSILSTHGIPMAVLLLLTGIMSVIERRRFGVYGFGGTRRLPDFVNGLFSGVLSLSLLVGVLYASHLLVFNGVLLSGAPALVSGLEWLAAFALVGFTEEFMFRGYLQYTIARGLSGILPRGNPYRRMLGFWLAATLLSVLFFAGHKGNPGESPVGLLSVFLIGLVLAYSLWRTGSLWWAIGYHITWDWAQSFVYGVGDSGIIIHGRLLATHPQGNALYSGGLTGPEGSLFVIPIGILLCLVIRYTLPKRPQPPLIPQNWRIRTAPLPSPLPPDPALTEPALTEQP